MTATYYERFYPRDMDGVVAYVAPNDVVNKEDSAYDRFFANVGTKECRDRLNAVQREALVRREPLEKKYAGVRRRRAATPSTPSAALDKAYEAVVLDYVWALLAVQPARRLRPHPGRRDRDRPGRSATRSTRSPASPPTPTRAWRRTRRTTTRRAPSSARPTSSSRTSSGLSRYGYQPPRNFVPRDIPMKFQPQAMRDVDNWVRHDAHQMLFVYGQNDPWGAEPFRLGKGARDSYVYHAPGANHGANVAGLVDAESETPPRASWPWAGVAPAAGRPRRRSRWPRYDAPPRQAVDEEDAGARRCGRRPSADHEVRGSAVLRAAHPAPSAQRYDRPCRPGTAPCAGSFALCTGTGSRPCGRPGRRSPGRPPAVRRRSRSTRPASPRRPASRAMSYGLRIATATTGTPVADEPRHQGRAAGWSP